MQTLKDFTFFFPTRIVFGCNSSQSVGEEVKKAGFSKVLVVTDEGFSKLPIFETLMGYLSNAGIRYRLFKDLKAEPDTTIVDQGARFLREGENDAILGIGGGSAIDLAKALSVLGRNEGSITEYVGVDLVKKTPLPLIAMPTTAGSGSEVTGVSVITDPEKKFKAAVVSPLIAPRVAIMDPAFLKSLSPKFIAETGMDALTHAIEAFCSLRSSLVSDMLAKESIRLIFLNLRALVANPKNMEAATAMLLGSMLAGAAFLNASVGNVHSLSQPLGAYYHIPHALATAMLLPYVMEYNLIANLERFSDMAALMGVKTEGLALREAAQKAIDEVKKLSGDIGIPEKLSELGVTDDHFREMAVDATKIPPYLFNPRRCTVDELTELYKNAL